MLAQTDPIKWRKLYLFFLILKCLVCCLYFLCQQTQVYLILFTLKLKSVFFHPSQTVLWIIFFVTFFRPSKFERIKSRCHETDLELIWVFVLDSCRLIFFFGKSSYFCWLLSLTINYSICSAFTKILCFSVFKGFRQSKLDLHLVVWF